MATTTHENGYACPGWHTHETQRGIVLRTCPECGLPASREEAAGAAAAAVEALFAARFGDDSNGALCALETALAWHATTSPNRETASASRDALACVRGILKEIGRAAERS